jgi:hypothetical protein
MLVDGGGGGLACSIFRQLVDNDPMLAPAIQGWEVVSCGLSSCKVLIVLAFPFCIGLIAPVLGLLFVLIAVLLMEMLNGLVPEVDLAA